MNKADAQKLCDFMQESILDKKIILTPPSCSWYFGVQLDIKDWRIYKLDLMNGCPTENSDELYQKIKKTVLHSAHLEQ